MIEQTPAYAPGDAVSMVILPHRSLSRAGFRLFMAAQSVATAGFALLAAWGGNVFAPVFALVELALVGYCLSRVWRSSAAGQIVVIGPTRLEIASMDGGEAPARFHPYWARVALVPGAWRNAPTRLLVRSHGREAEIGAFLNDEERSDLARRLTKLLAQMGDGSSDAAARG
jgi:uncharacterized membrane protein